jgi:D-beta-D-heptose 7-phosphate kinase/D-beta-D-heptose 1-phosphate adenosyltransferase
MALKDVIASKKILLVGEQCIDKYSYGTNDRINPESPSPLIKVVQEEQRLGMAGGMNENLLNLGLEVKSLLSENKIVKHRFIDLKTNHQVLRVDFDYQLESLEVSKIKKEEFDLVVVSDYDKGFITPEVINHLMGLYPDKLVVDTKRKDISIYEGVLVKMNKPDSLKSIKNENIDLVVTDGRNGAVYKNQSYPVQTTKLVDVTGAGDAFMIGLSLGLLISNDVGASIELANKFGSIAVQYLGVLRIDHMNATEIWKMVEEFFNA